jgi:hypothetical protein
MTRKLKVSLDGTQISHVFEERVFGVVRLHAVLIDMMNVYFEEVHNVGMIQSITEDTITYCNMMTSKAYYRGSIKFSIEPITE